MEEDLQEVEIKINVTEELREKAELAASLSREEAAGHITHIQSLEEMKVKLTEGLEEAITKTEKYKKM